MITIELSAVFLADMGTSTSDMPIADQLILPGAPLSLMMVGFLQFEALENKPVVIGYT